MSAPSAAPTLAVVRVLLLEDDVATAEAVASGLSARGYEVIHAADADAVAAIGLRQPLDVAILDLMVPGGGGYVGPRRAAREEPGASRC